MSRTAGETINRIKAGLAALGHADHTLRQRYRFALLDVFQDLAAARQRAVEHEFELAVAENWLAENDAEFLAAWQQRRDDPQNQIDDARLAGMIARITDPR